MRVHPGLAVPLLLAAACGPNYAESLDTQPQFGPVVALPLVDLRADTNRDGRVDFDNVGDDDGEDVWDARHGAVFLANIDDDTLRCPKTGTDLSLAQCNDAADEVINGPDDVFDLAPLKVAAWANAPAGTSGKISVNPGGMTRLFRKTEAGFELFDSTAATLSTSDVRSGVELFLEAKDIVRDPAIWDGYVTITLTVRTPDQEVSDTVKLRVSPVMTFHHLTAPETSYVTRVGFDQSSVTFVNALKGLIAQTPERAPLVEIADQDIWTQDFFETAYMSMPVAGGGQHVIRAAYRSSSVEQGGTSPLRSAGRIVFTRFRGKDSAGLQAFTLQQDPDSSSLNSYGNTETIPPFTHGGVSYPLGRLLRGDIPSFSPDPVMKKVMESQAVQPAVLIDTSWLLVGHVDETISFVPAPNARGWVLLLNDPTLARQMLQAEVDKGNGGVQMFIGKTFYDSQGRSFSATRSIAQVLNDTTVMSESAKAAAEVDAQLQIIRQATGITDAEIIRVPFLHTVEYGLSVAYQPGFVNGFLAGARDFIAPDPFGPVINGKDIFKADFEQKLSAIGVTVRWIDDWDLYHLGIGEVHCGTNAARQIPEAKWWEGGR